MTPGACARCGAAGRELRPVPVWLLWLTAVAFAFFHGGLWAHETLKRPICPACRLKTGALALGASLVTLAGAAAGVFLLLRLIRGL